jgi:hypothetical protein
MWLATSAALEEAADAEDHARHLRPITPALCVRAYAVTFDVNARVYVVEPKAQGP